MMGYLCGILNYGKRNEAISLTDKWVNRLRKFDTIKQYYEDNYLILREVASKSENREWFRQADSAPDHPRDSLHYVAFLSGETFLNSGLAQKSNENFGSVFAKYNISAFGLLNGGWVIALWDREKRQLLLARDPHGIEKIYYFKRKQQIYFSTRFKDLLYVSEELDQNGITLFLKYLYVPSPKTILKGASSVLPGEVVVFTSYGMDRVKYADSPYERLDHVGTVKSLNTNEIDLLVGKIEAKLSAAVKRRLSRNGNTVILLSGGKDSSSLCLAASTTYRGKKVKCVNVRCQNKDIDEYYSAKSVSEYLNLAIKGYD